MLGTLTTPAAGIGAASVGNRAPPHGGGGEQRRSSSGSDDNGGGFQARCASSAQKGAASVGNRAPPHGRGGSEAFFLWELTTTAAHAKRDARAAHQKGRRYRA